MSNAPNVMSCIRLLVQALKIFRLGDCDILQCLDCKALMFWTNILYPMCFHLPVHAHIASATIGHLTFHWLWQNSPGRPSFGVQWAWFLVGEAL